MQAWRERLGPSGGRRPIGLSWRGGGPTTGAAARSIPLADLAPVLAAADCDFVSLQYGDVADEVAAVNAALPRPILRFEPGEIDDFEQLAGLVSALDRVVSVQTAVIHLAGALGHPCHVLVPNRPEWRYMAAGEAMPWYRSVRLFRQAAGESWSPAIGRVAAAIGAEGTR
jgi:ADP-heptose:LPS heptosyltransferase